MFGRLHRLIDRVKNLDENEIAHKALEDRVLQSQILDLNTQSQLYDKGVDKFGRSLGEYSPSTIEGTSKYLGKIAKGQRYDHVTLRDTGLFYKSFRFINEPDGFVITADTLKEDNDLEKIFGDIIGLTVESRAELVEELRPRMQEILRKTLLA